MNDCNAAGPSAPDWGHPADWLVPDWPVPPRVRALCTSRNGGVSVGAYQSLNLGLHVGDDITHVQENRRRLQARLGVRPVFLNQVHGTALVSLDSGSQDATVADCALTSSRDVACVMMVADCLPILFCSADGSQVGGAHAGWRGLAGQGGFGVIESVAAALGRRGTDLYGTFVWLGPCIGPTAFEVGDEVRDAFVGQSAMAQRCFEPLRAGKWLANLPLLARQRLQALGMARIYGNDGSPAWCTVSNPSRFFSHRRDGVSGRLAACVWLAA